MNVPVHAMKAEVEVYLQSFLISVLDEDEWSVPPEKNPPVRIE
jgi:hypothetical protein